MKDTAGNIRSSLVRSNLIIAFIAVLSAIETDAQSIRRQTVGSSGIHATSRNTYVSHTVGQPYGTTTFNSERMAFRPGFQQPSFFQNTFIPASIRAEVSVYPNPATALVTVKLQEALHSGTLEVRNRSGYRMISEKIEDRNNYSFNCETWAPGFYYIIIRDHQTHDRYSSKLIISK
jgi:hypothetical protein